MRIVVLGLFTLSIVSIFTIPILFPGIIVAAFGSLGSLFAGCCIAGSSFLGLGIYSKKKRKNACENNKIIEKEVQSRRVNI